MNSLAKVFLALTFPLIIFSCGTSRNNDKEITTTGNVSTLISTDTSRLAKIIDFSHFKPTHAKFKYVYHDNSGQNDGTRLPGPSDSYLQAVLYFDEETFNSLLQENLKLSQIMTGRKTEYQFDWLDNDIKMELSKVDSSRNDQPSSFVSKIGNMSGGCFILDKKVLLKMH
jgi:hypothetical protein